MHMLSMNIGANVKDLLYNTSGDYVSTAILVT